LAGSFLLAALAGCSSYWFEAREPWRGEAEQQCLKAGTVKESPSVALLRPINGPGKCGADFPLKVAALGDSVAMSFADDLRPPASVPGGGPSYPPAAGYPQRMSAPAARAPQVYMPDDEYSPDADAADHDMPEMAPPARAGERWSDPPRTAAPAPAPRATQVPLAPSRGPIATAASVQPAATLACPIVSALDRWIIDSVQPAAMRWFQQPIVEIRQISAYSCRGMNGQPGAHISEHAFGNALDIAAFTLADGRKISVEHGWRGLPEEQGFLRDVQAAACEQFTTVLAPGSNRFHYNHIHVDLMRRASGRHICQPQAVSGEEIPARAAQSGRASARRDEPYARRDDPFAWRGGARSRDGGPTGSVKVDVHKPAAYQATDDEDVPRD
jgi:hypothetical protein